MASNSRYSSLNRRADFLALKSEGKVVHVNSWLLLNWRRGLDARIRCGWTISTHIGSSVIRNRLKRWGREFFRRWSAHQSSEKGIDVNMILKRRPKGFYSALTHEEFDEAMARAAAKLR